MQTQTRVQFWNKDINVLQDGQLAVAWMLFWWAIHVLGQKHILWPIARFLIRAPTCKEDKVEITKAENKQTLKNRLRSDLKGAEISIIPGKEDRKLENKRWKFVASASKMFSYIFCLGFSAWALQDQWHWFWDPTQWHYTFEHIPWRMRSLYFMEISYYLFTMVYMFFEPRMKDRGQMVAHHIFTIILIGTSYVWNQAKYGTPIMVLHDFSDPWMEAAKLFNYLDIELGSNICFSVFALSFIFLRDYVFPHHVIRATYDYARPAGSPHYWITFTSLMGLWVLHLFWTVLISRVFYENVVKRNKKGDIREEDD